MPDLASRRLANTSWVLLPMDETMPIPVTTTRLIEASPASADLPTPEGRVHLPNFARLNPLRRLQRLGVAEQSDLEIGRLVDHRAVGREPAVGDAEHQLGAHHPLDFEAIDHVLHGRQHLAGKLELAEAQRPALAG